MIPLFVAHSIIESKHDVSVRLDDSLKQISNLSFVSKPVFLSSNESMDLISSEFEDPAGVIVFISSGGSEAITESIVKKYNKPVLLIAFGGKNSLAASIELYSFLKNDHVIKLIYYENDQIIIDAINTFYSVSKTINRINRASVGLVGSPSDWLLHSRNVNSFGKFTTKLVNLNTETLMNYVEKIDDTEPNKEQLIGHYNHNLPSNSINNSLKVYSAMKKLIDENSLDALTIRCFDLLENQYTACMGMSFCNDEGIVAGCEGDLHATFSMMIGTYLTDKPCWMANPSTICINDNTLVLAHCTVPSKMISDNSKAELTTHMESGMSVANHGPLKLGTVTIFRIGNNFDKIVATTGEIFDTDMRDPSLCRTQANIKLNCSVTDWMEDTLGNHQIVVYGDISDHLKLFADFAGIEISFIRHSVPTN